MYYCQKRHFVNNRFFFFFDYCQKRHFVNNRFFFFFDYCQKRCFVKNKNKGQKRGIRCKLLYFYGKKYM